MDWAATGNLQYGPRNERVNQRDEIEARNNWIGWPGNRQIDALKSPSCLLGWDSRLVIS